MDKLHVQLRVVFYKDGDVWIAHCLEMGVMGHGATEHEAFTKLNEAIAIQIDESVKHGNLANLFMPVDAELLRMFFAGKKKLQGEMMLTVDGFAAKTDGIVFEGLDARQYTGELALA